MQHPLQNLTKERVASPRMAVASPHLIDLAADAKRREAEAPARRAPRGQAFFSHILNERVHLRDLRHRRISTHHLDWKDFPPRDARDLPHAIAVTARRFFTEHPLADLTILTVLHLTVVVVFKAFILPIERLAGVATVADDKSAVATGGLEASTMSVPSEDSKLSPAVMRAVDTRGASSEDAKVEERITAHNVADFSTASEEEVPRDVHRTSGFLGLSFALPAGWARGVLGFAITAAIVLLPFGAYDAGGFRLDIPTAKERANAAVAMLKTAEDSLRSLDLVGASAALASAADDFGAARESLGAFGSIMNAAAGALPIETKLTSAAPLLLAGQEASRGAAELASKLSGIDAVRSPMEKLRLARAGIDAALPHLDIATEAISHVSASIAPENYRDDIELAKLELPRLTAALHDASDAAAVLEGLLGADGTRRYLVAFQNNAELRPTGGFIGSFALIDIKDGEVQAMEIPGGGSYDLQGSLSLRLNAPQPLRLINPRWEFQDANWYPDFPTSAKTLARFYDKSGGPSVDGVIAINATFMEKLLGVTGPIDMPEYGKTISAQNFFYETQKQVEIDYDKDENAPKRFIGDLAPKMLAKLTSGDRASLIALTGILRDGLAEKELLIWSRDEAAQGRLAAFGWDGAMRAGDGDYLAVVHTNIAGQKTDLAMREKIEHAAKIMPDGETVVTLTVAREHTGQAGALFSGVRNVDYLRVYVPRGSELLEARGFEPPDPKLFSMTEAGNEDDALLAAEEATLRTDRISGTRMSEENGFTVFGNWVQTDPGESSVVTLVYRLPPGTARLEERSSGALGDAYALLVDAPRTRLEYSLAVHKQSGAHPAEFVSTVDMPRTFVPIAVAPERTQDERGRLVANVELRTDFDFDVVAESQ